MVGDSGSGEVLSAYDIGSLSAEQRSELSAMLEGYGVAHRLVGPELQGPGAEAELIEDLIATVSRPVEARPDLPSPYGRLDPVPRSRLRDAIAPRWRRFVAFLVEAVAAAVVLSVVATATSYPAGRVVGFVLSVASGLVLVATTGRTVGMWLFDMKVVVPPAVEVPGWTTASVRFLVVAWPALAALVLAPFVPTSVTAWFGVVDALWLFVCFGPILFDPYCRGLHDRAARTVVVNADSVAPLD